MIGILRAREVAKLSPQVALGATCWLAFRQALLVPYKGDYGRKRTRKRNSVNP